MQKNVTIITIILVSLVFLGVTVGVYLATSADFVKKSEVLATEIESAQTELDALEAAKDINGFTPTEVVKAFFYEVKSALTEKAKLYLSPEVQDMDISATLKLGNELANVNTDEYFEESDGEDYTVNMTFILETEETTVRSFTLSKYDEAWKITGVTAE